MIVNILFPWYGFSISLCKLQICWPRPPSSINKRWEGISHGAGEGILKSKNLHPNNPYFIYIYGLRCLYVFMYQNCQKLLIMASKYRVKRTANCDSHSKKQFRKAAKKIDELRDKIGNILNGNSVSEETRKELGDIASEIEYVFFSTSTCTSNEHENACNLSLILDLGARRCIFLYFIFIPFSN